MRADFRREVYLARMASNAHHRAGSKGSPRVHAIDVAETKAPIHGAAVADACAKLGGSDGPDFFSYPNFVCYLMRASSTLDRNAFAETFARSARLLLDAAKGPVYLADGTAFADDNVHEEFPEIRLFHLQMSEAFFESPVCPGIFIETPRFTNLHLLSRMRREMQRTKTVTTQKTLDVLKILLGLEEVPKNSV